MKSILAPLLLASTALGHATWQEMWVNGVDVGRYNAWRLPTYDGPINDVTSRDMTCNGGPNPLVMNSTIVASAKAGDTIKLLLLHTLDTAYPGGMVIDSSHLGPVLVYMAKTTDALGTPPTSGWFKVYADGYSNGVWGINKLINSGGTFEFTIPSCIAPGDYFIRPETISLHAAGSNLGAQLYMECAQVRITAGGSTSPPTYNIPGVYAQNDPGILYNLYAATTTYQIPGPTVFSCGGSSGGTTTSTRATSTAAPTSTSRATSSSSTRTTLTTSSTRATTSTTVAGGSCASMYGQCGGISWTGPTCCSSGTCTKSNDYYSQCL